MSRTLIQKHSSSIVRALVERVNALSDLDHKLTKGELRELFVSNILNSFLTSQFGIGSGIVINQKGEQSRQNDIIIYDNRILPPFIKEQNIGVYPAESVIATIEVKSWLRKKELLNAEKSARELHENVYNPTSSIYGDYQYLRRLCAVIGFYGNGVKELSEENSGKSWLNEYIKHLFAVCLVNRYSWLYVVEPSWRFKTYDKKTNEETKRFIAVILDNIRTYSEGRFRKLTERHKDWLGIYTRDRDRDLFPS